MLMTCFTDDQYISYMKIYSVHSASFNVHVSGRNYEIKDYFQQINKKSKNSWLTIVHVHIFIHCVLTTQQTHRGWPGVLFTNEQKLI